MFDEGSAMKAEQGAACETQPILAEWFCCWDTVEALARDADRLYAKCGTKCSVEELKDWRDRVLAQLKTVLDDEERIFESLRRPEEPAAKMPPGAALGSAA